MLNISDILKKARGKNKGKGPLGTKEEQPSLTSPQNSPAVRPEKESVPRVQAQIKETAKEAFLPSLINEPSHRALTAYNQGVSLSRKIIAEFTPETVKAVEEAKRLVNEFIEIARGDADSLELLFLRDYGTEKGYLFEHAVNVCMLALKMGVSLNFDYERLQKLGIAALLHDIGLVKFDALISEPRRLSESEKTELKKHPLAGQDMLKQFSSQLPVEIFDAVRQEHERIDGSGYPYGLQKNDISEFARIIGLIDKYEALSHSRPYRGKRGCLETLSLLLKQKNAYEHKFLKMLINDIGVFPTGNFVELNTKETAVVLKQNKKMPLRPIIDIIYGTQGEKLDKSKQIDLSKNFSIFIKDCCRVPHSNF